MSIQDKARVCAAALGVPVEVRKTNRMFVGEPVWSVRVKGRNVHEDPEGMVSIMLDCLLRDAREGWRPGW